MDRESGPPSPSCISRHDSSTTTSSRDSTKSAPRKSQYRLFPVVLPTPPASPVTLQRTSPSTTSGSFRHRRSSSVEGAAAKVSAALSASATLPASYHSSSLREYRKASLSEILPLQTVREAHDLASTLHDPTNMPDRSTDAAAIEHGSFPNDPSSHLDRDRHAEALHANDISTQTVMLAEEASAVNLTLSPVVESPRNPSNTRLRNKPKPNLRINIIKRGESTTSRPAPPLESPGHASDRTSSHPAQVTSQGQPQLASSSLTRNRPHKAPATPGLVSNVLSEANPPFPTRNDKDLDLLVSPDAPRGRSARKVAAPAPEAFSSDAQDWQAPEGRPRPTLPKSMGSAPNLRSETGIAGSVPYEMLPSRTSTDSSDSRTKGLSGQPSRSNLRSRLLPSFTRGKQEPTRPRKPVIPQQRTTTDWKTLNPPTPIVDRFAIPKKSSHEEPMPDLVNTFFNTESNLSAGHLPNRNAAADPPSSVVELPADDSYTPSAALTAARAQVAALTNSIPTTGDEPWRPRTSGSETASLSRRPPNQALPRPPSAATTDPIATLKTLTEECDFLHSRYAALKAERQRISGAIIARLKEPVPAPELVDILLNDQLSLAAVSSSQDICLAKLKSLECRRDDAIAALIAKSTLSERRFTDDISAMIASLTLSRKPSSAQSLGSSHYAPTGRSTPDIGDRHRLPRGSTRTMSYGSESECLDVTVSVRPRKQSVGGSSSISRSESDDRSAPATIVEVTETIHGDPVPDGQVPLANYSSVRDVIANGHLRADSVDDDSADELQWAVPSNRISFAEFKVSREGRSMDRLARTGNNTKAAKLLGLLHRPGQDMAGTDAKTGDSAPVRPSPLSEQISSTSSTSQPDQASSNRAYDLEQQIKSFPEPRSTVSHLDERRHTGGSSLTNGSSADSSCAPSEPERVPCAAVKSSLPDSNKKPHLSAHIVNVYLDNEYIY